MKNNDKTHESISFGITLITFGIVALFVSLGFTTWANVFQFFLTYWPLFIVVAGLKMVLSAATRSSAVGLIIDFLVAIGILAAISVPAIQNVTKNLQNNARDNAIEQSDRKTVALNPAAENISYKFTIGAASFTLLDSQKQTYALVAESQNGVVSVTDTFNPATYLQTVSFDNANTEIRFLSPITTFERKYTLETSSTLPASYALKVGAASGVATFTQAKIQDFNLDLGAGDMELTFSESATPRSMNVSVGAGSTTIRVPKSHTIHVLYTVGAGDITINGESFGGLANKGEKSVSGTTENALYLTVQVGAGDVDVISY